MTQNKFKKIFVGGLPPQTSENDMREYFSKYGEVCDVVAMRDKTGNKSRGFGFVVFKEAESVDKCQAERPHYLLGKIVDTKRAMPKEESINPDIHCNSKRIFIGGIRKFFTEDDLRNYFGTFGQVIDCTIKRDNVSGISRGFAFITFTDRDIVDKVILSKPHQIKNCIVDVKKALSPEELRQIDESQSYHNNSDYDLDYGRINKNGSFDQEEDGKIISDTCSINGSKFGKKFSPKRSQSYSQPEYSSPTSYPNNYIVMSPDHTTGPASSTHAPPPPYSYDTQVPMIWMSVQQCSNGLLLTPVAHDIYNGGPLSSFFFPPTSSSQQMTISAYASNTPNNYFSPSTPASTMHPQMSASMMMAGQTLNGQYDMMNYHINNNSDQESSHTSPPSTSSPTKLDDLSDLKDALPKLVDSHDKDDYQDSDGASNKSAEAVTSIQPQTAAVEV